MSAAGEAPGARWLALLALSSAVLWAGCSGGDVPVAPAAVPVRPAKVPADAAVLPFDNETTSLVAPTALRGRVAEGLAGMGLRVPPIDGTDEKLRAIGVTDGGQLRAFKTAEIGKAVGAEGLVYGTVEQFSFTNLGFFVRKAVRLRLRLVSASTGEQLWEQSGEAATNRFVTKQKDAGKSFVEGLIEQALEGALNNQLSRESKTAVEKALRDYPGR